MGKKSNINNRKNIAASDSSIQMSDYIGKSETKKVPLFSHTLNRLPEGGVLCMGKSEKWQGNDVSIIFYKPISRVIHLSKIKKDEK
jgi:hypothetical protein